MMSQKIFIVTGNHNELNAISDLIQIIFEATKGAFPSAVVFLSDSPRPNEINFIIEEFSSREFCRQLVSVKNRYPRTKLFLLLTELATTDGYNLYEFGDRIKHLLHKLTKEIFSELDAKRDIAQYIIDDEVDALASDLKLSCEFDGDGDPKRSISAVAIQNLTDFFAGALHGAKGGVVETRIGRKIASIFDVARYWRVRFINTKYLIKLNYIFDRIFIMHHSPLESMQEAFQAELGVFPYRIVFARGEFDRAFDIYFSGKETSSRMRQIKKIQDDGFSVRWDTGFSDISRSIGMSQSLYSLHLPRYVGWEFSSPTRTLSALRVGAIPLFLKGCILDRFELDLDLPFLEDVCGDDGQRAIGSKARDVFVERSVFIQSKMAGINAQNAEALRSCLGGAM